MRKAALILLLLAAPLMAQAQYWTALDRDIKGMRDCLVPDFSINYGDWIQYGPGALCYGLKFCGLESRSGLGRMGASHLFGAGITAAIDGILKTGVSRERPDGSASNSFPSGHTATAFLTAGWLHTEFGWRYPWVDAVGYGLGVSTAMHRILRNKHWATDTMAGAVVGTFSSIAGYWLADWALDRFGHWWIFNELPDRLLGPRWRNSFWGHEAFWGMNPDWESPEVDYDPALKYFEAEFFYSMDFALADGCVGSGAGMQFKIPYGSKGRGALVRGSVTGNGENGSVSWFAGAGAGRDILLLPRWEVGLHALAGCTAACTTASGVPHFACLAGASTAYILGYSSKIKLFAEYALQPDAARSTLSIGASAALYF